jgi:hypothetical protein
VARANDPVVARGLGRGGPGTVLKRAAVARAGKALFVVPSETDGALFFYSPGQTCVAIPSAAPSPPQCRPGAHFGGGILAKTSPGTMTETSVDGTSLGPKGPGTAFFTGGRLFR